MPQAFFQVATHTVGVHLIESITSESCSDGHAVQMMWSDATMRVHLLETH